MNNISTETQEKLFEQIEQFKKAVRSLRDAIDEQETDLERDGCIQRFEFCVDLMWKTLKTYLSVNHKIECNSPKTCVREAFAVDLLGGDDPLWLEMLDMRNLTVHTYKEEVAAQIFAALPETLKRFEALAKKMSVTT